MQNKGKTKGKTILAVGCCEHLIRVFEGLESIKLISKTSRNNINNMAKKYEFALIVVGIEHVLVKRIFLNKIRYLFSDVPLLILRLEKVNRGEAGEQLRGDFLINDRQKPFDLEIVNKARKLFPLKPCHHLQRSNDYELARETMKIISENYYDSDLSLNDVAEKLHASPSKLSKVLNQQVGISFRKLLKQIRIEKAKLILSSHRFSIKEVAIRVGFSDRHYFSRSFKEVTGMNATEYEVTAEDLLLN